MGFCIKGLRYSLPHQRWCLQKEWLEPEARNLQRQKDFSSPRKKIFVGIRAYCPYLPLCELTVEGTGSTKNMGKEDPFELNSSQTL